MTTPKDLAAALNVLDQLPTLLKQRRESLGLTMGQAGAQIGISGSAVHLAEHGAGLSVRTARLILCWLAETTEGGKNPAGQAAGSSTSEEFAELTPAEGDVPEEAVEAALTAAWPDLASNAVPQMSRVMRTALTAAAPILRVHVLTEVRTALRVAYERLDRWGHTGAAEVVGDAMAPLMDELVEAVRYVVLGQVHDADAWRLVRGLRRDEVLIVSTRLPSALRGRTLPADVEVIALESWATASPHVRAEVQRDLALAHPASRRQADEPELVEQDAGERAMHPGSRACEPCRRESPEQFAAFPTLCPHVGEEG